MNCFVACAFQHKDVDAIYKIVKNVLESFGITALRVDKISHNKKIDQKIIELINKCDFGIADLTYARQSVYYEAGRIHGRGKEVVFTCRSDHFTGTADDKRIHFDLITENVIGWSASPTKFKRDLTRRIKQVIIPLLREKADKEKIDKEQQDFARLSIFQKRDEVEKQIKQSFAKAKWTLIPTEHENNEVFGVKNPKGQKQDIISGFVANSYTYKQLGDLWGYPRRRMYMLLMKTQSIPGGFLFDKGHSTMVICSLSKVAENSLQKACPQYSKVESHEKIYASVKHNEKVILLDNIKSIPDLKARIESVL